MEFISYLGLTKYFYSASTQTTQTTQVVPKESIESTHIDTQTHDEAKIIPSRVIKQSLDFGKEKRFGDLWDKIKVDDDNSTLILND